MDARRLRTWHYKIEKYHVQTFSPLPPASCIDFLSFLGTPQGRKGVSGLGSPRATLCNKDHRATGETRGGRDGFRATLGHLVSLIFGRQFERGFF